MNKILPWLISVALAIALAVVHYHYKGIIAAKDVELQAASERNASLVTEAENRLKEAGEKVTAANERLQQLATEARAKLQALTTEANEKLQVANQPEPTVLVSFRKAFLGSGGVATIKNTASQAISVSLVAARSATNQQRQFELVVDGGLVKEIGERDGWAFLSGDTLKISQPSHKVVTFTVK
jgi:hypothetical protein